MAMSRSARIKLLLSIDVLFFFIEIIVGYAVGSLALVADSFHMLNDVMSLVVALYAIELTAQGSTDSRYSYGWHRAEILAALINGVFLLALCFSISLEALERFFSTPEVSNPRLVVIVGSWGLASNIVGLFLFHEHGHSHDHGKPSTPSSKPASIKSLDNQIHTGDSDSTQRPQIKIKRNSRGRSRSDSYSSLYGHPAATRASLVQAAQDMARARSPSPSRLDYSSPSQSRAASSGQSAGNLINGRAKSSPESENIADGSREASERTPLLQNDQHHGSEPTGSTLVEDVTPKTSKGHNHGHSHSGSMNMRAIILHVLGDALGNVGVIATGLVIWLTSWSFKYYFDPIISLVITVIIFSSAMPLVRSASFILLQGVPSTVSLEDVRATILDVKGVLSVHELHIWQLSESKIVASVHVMVSRKHDFMPIAAEIRKGLHHHGIHSSTIQPEYYHPYNGPPEERLMSTEDTSCLILCPPDADCDPLENACCPPPVVDA